MLSPLDPKTTRMGRHEICPSDEAMQQQKGE